MKGDEGVNLAEEPSDLALFGDLRDKNCLVEEIIDNQLIHHCSKLSRPNQNWPHGWFMMYVVLPKSLILFSSWPKTSESWGHNACTRII